MIPYKLTQEGPIVELWNVFSDEVFLAARFSIDREGKCSFEPSWQRSQAARVSLEQRWRKLGLQQSNGYYVIAHALEREALHNISVDIDVFLQEVVSGVYACRGLPKKRREELRLALEATNTRLKPA